jgi:hypothetical protein
MSHKVAATGFSLGLTGLNLCSGNSLYEEEDGKGEGMREEFLQELNVWLIHF